ncbi:MAG TPA: RodZ domain-containing protein [Solirubrobacterales bacterium]|nr:RodZ domain-containing protein [Solirubrobacterales bacterium]
MDGSVGSKLREARTRRKLSLAEVEAATKIRPRYLQALENEEWDQLPGDTYTRAFIRTYGRFLGLDGERLAEEQRRGRGAARPGDRLPRVDPRPRPVARRRPGRHKNVPPRLVAGLVIALVVAALLAIGLSTGGSDESPTGGGTKKARAKAPASKGSKQAKHQAAPTQGHALKLVATEEVWVCLVGGRNKPLVDGRILAAGETEGPFRSGSFTLALGNGAVTMMVDGKEQELPESASPIGFAVGSDGSVRELPEGDRPTCT